MLREGSGEPLVLFHGILCSERVWSGVVPLLRDDFEVIVPNAIGHRGGPEPTSRPATIDALVDAAEGQLDELGIRQAHLAGNSLGGWMALELARRGRARSVCALSPAGFWDEAWEAERERTFTVLRAAMRDVRRGRRIAPTLARSRRFRRWAMREACLHGDRMTREAFLGAGEDTLECIIGEELLVAGYSLGAMEAPCPVTIAWSAGDRLFPLNVYEERGRTLIGESEFLVLDDVGHIPMYDDPQLVADTIRATAARASASGAALSSRDS
jgi:pimeloyl-ACP methyl ester carboxylesterase